MKILRFIFLFFCLIGISVAGVSADSFFYDETPTTRYDNSNNGLDQGITVIKDSLGGIETSRSASEYIQDVVTYLLMFISLIAVIYIIYAGFQILIGSGDEEKMKKSRQTIIYVIIGIVVIWLAWPITRFILAALNG